MYDVEKNTAPENVLKLFYRISSVHTNNARVSTSEHFHIKESRINVKRNAFSRAGVKIWNSIPQMKKKTKQNKTKQKTKKTKKELLKDH